MSNNDEIIASLRRRLDHRKDDGTRDDGRAILAYLCGFSRAYSPDIADEIQAWLDASRPQLEGSVR